jgi:hypothetical protein
MSPKAKVEGGEVCVCESVCQPLYEVCAAFLTHAFTPSFKKETHMCCIESATRQIKKKGTREKSVEESQQSSNARFFFSVVHVSFFGGARGDHDGHTHQHDSASLPSSSSLFHIPPRSSLYVQQRKNNSSVSSSSFTYYLLVRTAICVRVCALRLARGSNVVKHRAPHYRHQGLYLPLRTAHAPPSLSTGPLLRRSILPNFVTSLFFFLFHIDSRIHR